MKYLAIVFGLLLSLNTLATPYSLEDYEVDAYLERTVETGYGLGRINGFGLDYPFVVHTGIDDQKQYSNVFMLDVDKDKFTIDFIATTGWVEGIVFRLVQQDYAATTLQDFWSTLNIDTNIEGLTVTSGLGWVELNFSNIRFTQDSYFTGSFNYQEVPEPLSIGLLLLGLFILYLRNFRHAR